MGKKILYTGYGQRVITQSGFMKVLGRARQAKGRSHYDSDVNMPAFLTAKNLKPYISKDLEVTSKGYTKENTRMVCWIYNRAKGYGTDSDVLMLAEALCAQ